MKNDGLPIEGKSMRFAPGRNQEPAARFWKIWAEGSEIYAIARTPQGLAKISIHASGQIHYRLGPKHKQDLTPLMQLGRGPWMHAFEIRFLLSAGSSAPHDEKLRKNKLAYVIPVPEGFVFHANLIVGAAGTPPNSPLPLELGGAQALWRTQLRDGRPAVLIGRMVPLDSQNRDLIRYFREELKPTVTFSGKPEKLYVEIHNLRWSPEGGNVVLVVPMGDEAIRSEEGMTAPIGPSGGPRPFRYKSLRSTAAIIAPNGAHVALLEIESVDKQIELVKNQPSIHTVGTLKIKLEPGNLIAGSEFMTTPVKFICVPSVDGCSPNGWGYQVSARFDGDALSVEFGQNSAALRNRNLATPIIHLDDTEELLLQIPWQPLKLIATMSVPNAFVGIPGRFTLRDSCKPSPQLRNDADSTKSDSADTSVGVEASLSGIHHKTN